MPPAEASPRPLALQLLPFATCIFLAYLAVGIPLAVLPLQVHDALGYGAITVGVVIGLQPLSTLLTRQLAGRLCDSAGPKRTVLLGFAVSTAAGLLYLASTLPALPPAASLAILAAGRVVLGLGDSLFITGTAAWMIARVGAANAGRALAWQGMAMYGAMAFGAALGGAIQDIAGFSAVCTGVIAMPLLAASLATFIPGVPAPGARRGAFLGILRAIWPQGLGIALASSGYGTLAAFLALHFHAQNWPGSALALTGFGTAYILMRVLFGGLPDRAGGLQVAAASLAVEAAGLVLIWSATTPTLAFAGTAVTGLGYSLVFPSLGVLAMRQVSPADRSMMLAVYLACFDFGLGAAGPLAGLVVSSFGLPAAFLAAAAAVTLSIAVVTATRQAPRPA